MTKKNSQKRIVGWREYVTLTELNVENVVAKIDTGANVATIDAADIKFVTRKDVKYVKFTVKKRAKKI